MTGALTRTRKPLPGNVIPPDRIDPVALALAQDFMTMAPNAAGGAVGVTASLTDQADQFSVNLNHSFSEKWQLAGTYMRYDSVEPNARYYRELLGTADEPPWGEVGDLARDVNVLTINNTYIPSDDSVLTLRFGWTRSAMR